MDRIKKVVAWRWNNGDATNVTRDSRFMTEDFPADDNDMFELMHDIELEFGINILDNNSWTVVFPNADAQIMTVQDVYNYVKDKCDQDECNMSR